MPVGVYIGVFGHEVLVHNHAQRPARAHGDGRLHIKIALDQSLPRNAAGADGELATSAEHCCERNALQEFRGEGIEAAPIGKTTGGCTHYVGGASKVDLPAEQGLEGIESPIFDRPHAQYRAWRMRAGWEISERGTPVWGTGGREFKSPRSDQ